MNNHHPIRLADRFRQLRGMRILIVEDNELNQEVALELMKSVGIEASIASDGFKAIEMLQSHTFDAILMDVQMPEMDGYTATREIRKMNSEIPIIAMTANATAEDRRCALESGMNDFLTKPIVPYQLFTMLSKWFSLRPAETSPPYQENEGLSAEFQALDVEMQSRLPMLLPGIDVAAGVVRIGGNLSRYITLLQQFVNRYAGIPDEFTDLFAHQNIAQVRQLIHTLKGVASNLGVYMLHKDLEAFEADLRADRRELWDVHLQQIRRSFRQVMDAVAALSSAEYAAPPAEKPPALPRKILDRTIVLPCLLQLRHFLAENDTESLRSITVLIEICADTELAPQLGHIKTMVDQYAFDRALEAIEPIVLLLNNVP